MDTKRVFVTMNAMRGVAALTVVAFHYAFRGPLHIEHGYLAVDLFFALSGFVIAYSYEERLLGTMSFLEFTVRRFIRLYPLYIFGTLLSVVFIAISFLVRRELTGQNADLLKVVPWAAIMAPYPAVLGGSAKAVLYPLNLPAWSLFFEIVANLVYAATIRFWNTRTILVLMAVTAALLAFNGIRTGDFDGVGGWTWRGFDLALLRVFYSFPAGVLVYRLYKSGMSVPALPGLLVTAAFPLMALVPNLTPLATPALVFLGFPLLVALAAGCREPKGLGHRISDVLGATSYAIYAIHIPLHTFVTSTLTRLHVSVPPMVLDSVMIVAIVPLAMALDSFYDAPVRRALTAWFVPLTRRRVAQAI